jgi:hypothetical protein
MLLYYYIYYLVYKWYGKSKDENPSLRAVIIVTVLQLITLFSIIALPIRLKHEKLNLTNWVVFVIAVVVILLNYLFFHKVHTPEKIAEKINSLSGSKTHLLQILMWVHIVVTVGLFIFLVNLP